jgi:enoyl-CoA hydratase
VEGLGADETTRVVVLKAAGPTFCAGADVTPVTTAVDPPGALEDRRHMLEHRFGRFLVLWDLPQPVIAQVHGHCLGLGVALCSCADLLVCAEDATIGWPLPMGGGVTGPAMALHIGMRRAKELSFLPASTMTGIEAAASGWANRAVPAVELDAVVDDLATRMARVPSGVLRIKKAAINQTFDRLGFRDAVLAGPGWNALAHTDPEVAELRAMVRELGIREATARLRGH